MRLLPSREIGDRSFALWRWQDIPCGDGGGRTYMTKLYLARTPWFQVGLHWLRLPDPDRALHDHPRSFVSLILRGAYVEERPIQSDQLWTRDGDRWYQNVWATVRKRWSVAYRRAGDLHRIALVAPGTVTLCVWGPKRREWGFQTRHGWVHWRTYLGVGQGERPWESA